jgi:putative two-component system response regulator
MAIADSFEAMTTTQFHREPRTPQEAAAEIEKASGTHYDPAIVAAFKKALPTMQKVRDTFSDALGNLINLDFAKAPAAKK